MRRARRSASWRRAVAVSRSHPRQLLALDPPRLSHFLRRGEMQGLDAFLATHLSIVDANDPELRAVIDFLVTDMLVAIANFVQELGGAVDEVIPARAALEPILAAIESVDDSAALYAPSC